MELSKAHHVFQSVPCRAGEVFIAHLVEMLGPNLQACPSGAIKFENPKIIIEPCSLILFQEDPFSRQSVSKLSWAVSDLSGR